jgi:NTP pyrophosphatase (non-canonical NTP hydrolase)
MEIAKFQDLIRKTYHRRDKKRGLDKNFIWFTEEVGRARRGRPEARQEGDLRRSRDVLAWLATICSLSGIDLEKAALAKYGKGCPRCAAIPCACP